MSLDEAAESAGSHSHSHTDPSSGLTRAYGERACSRRCNGSWAGGIATGFEQPLRSASPEVEGDPMNEPTKLTAPDETAAERIRAAREVLMNSMGIEPVDPSSEASLTSCSQWRHFDNG